MESENRASIQRLGLEWLSAALSNGFASAVLNPLDVSKTRMQAEIIDGKSGRGLCGTLKLLWREGGLIGLWKPGLKASMAREFLYSGSRAGFYVPIRNHLNTTFQFEAELPSKILAAIVTGIIVCLSSILV